jgi:hypothetical protein
MIVTQVLLVLQGWQLGDIRRYAPCLIESQRIGNSGIARISVALDVGDGLLVGVNDLEAAVYHLNGPWCWEPSHWQRFSPNHGEFGVDFGRRTTMQRLFFRRGFPLSSGGGSPELIGAFEASESLGAIKDVPLRHSPHLSVPPLRYADG